MYQCTMNHNPGGVPGAKCLLIEMIMLLHSFKHENRLIIIMMSYENRIDCEFLFLNIVFEIEMNGFSKWSRPHVTIQKCENENAKFMRENFGEKWIKRLISE